MTIAPGARLGHYEVLSPLGKGGMGEVYRATDTKLKRDVALKLLPESFIEDPERLARFEREAQLLAQLQHPNIASIFGIEENDGVRALVMELVEGPTLAERLESGALPLEEALSVARQIAEALEAAHDKGIVHRDLKPANIKLRPDGTVKVLDFGLAKAWESESGGTGLSLSPTVTSHHTRAGVVLGTAAYMSPEQARGKQVDKRADIWAFGVVLWEMLTGRHLFDGETVSDVLANVLKAEVPLSALAGETPAPVRELLRRCLERDPRNRLHDVADARIVIQELLEGDLDETAAAVAPGPGRVAELDGALGWWPSPWERWRPFSSHSWSRRAAPNRGHGFRVRLFASSPSWPAPRPRPHCRPTVRASLSSRRSAARATSSCSGSVGPTRST